MKTNHLTCLAPLSAVANVLKIFPFSPSLRSPIATCSTYVGCSYACAEVHKYVLSFSKLAIGYMGICGEDSQLARFLAQTTYFQLAGFLFAIIGWSLCISATSLGQWRQWHIENTTEFQSGVMWIGIWEVCYDTNPPDTDYYEINCKSFEASHIFLPKEIFIAQDLMSLCAVVETLALGFFFFAYWNIIKNEDKRRITPTFFTVGGFLSLTSGTVVLIPVTWNMLSILKKENINFPAAFGMPSRPKYQYIGLSIHLGFVAAVLQILSGLLFLGNKCLLIHKRTHPSGSKISSRKDSDSCPCCGSSLYVGTSGHYKRFCEGSRDKRRPAKPEVTFHIPMGPIPDQRVAHSDSKPFRVVGDTAYF